MGTASEAFVILVTGAILARPESVDELAALSLDHVRRSRTEPGCVMHAVHRDVENPLRLLFVEEWADRAALATHFAVPASIAFARAVVKLAAQPPEMKVYDATLTRV